MVSFIRSTLGPLALMLSCPPFVFVVWITVTKFNGSLIDFGLSVAENPSKIWDLLPPHTFEADLIVGAWLLIELFLLALVPGQKFLGPPSEHGTQPEYILNGVACYFITMIGYSLLAYFGVFNGGLFYDHFGSMIFTLQIIAPVLCTFLYIKGYLFPSTKDCDPSGNPILDYYWGIELYPTIPFTKLSFKQWINCRHGMMIWNVLILSFMWKQYELYGFVSNSMAASFIIQSVYILKFYVWENGYFTSIDIMHDRFGFYIAWGCTVFIAGTYTLCSFYLTTHPIEYHPVVALGIIGLGVFSVWANYDADNQRLKFRAADGKIKIWGKPAEYIVAKYTTTDGKQRESKLLVTGWWGVARHFNYIWELTLAFAWTVPVGFTHALPWFYFVFLCILLTDRAVRDDQRCARKYGKDYEKYCARVPYRMIPFVY